MPGGPMGGPPPMMGKGPMGGPPGRRRPPHGDLSPMPQPREKADDFYEENFDMARLEKECEEMLEFHYLTKEQAIFSKSAGNFINLTFHGKLYENVAIVRTFPFHEPDCFLSVRESIGKKKEIGMIQNLTKDFDKETVAIIRDYLNVRYYMPSIQKIIHVKEEGGHIHFTIMTDHGKTAFTLQSNGSHFTYLDHTRILITDLEGNRFIIPDINQLNSKDMKKLDLYM